MRYSVRLDGAWLSFIAAQLGLCDAPMSWPRVAPVACLIIRQEGLRPSAEKGSVPAWADQDRVRIDVR
jgi:hypothetical protein